MYEIIHKPGFDHDFELLPKAEQKKARGGVDSLRQNPFGNLSKRIFKDKYENLYRWRIGGHRIVYTVGTSCVALYAVKPRDMVYEWLDRQHLDDRAIDVATAAVRAIATAAGDPIPSSLPDGRDPEPQGPSAPRPGAEDLLRGLLGFWEIPEEHHKRILKCRTPEELFDLGIDTRHIETILHLHNPPTIEQLEEQPALALEDPEDLERWSDGTLSGFLLRLDPEQEKVAAKTIKGPAMIKGGPGTGKSIVALYRIRNLFMPEIQKGFFAGAKPKVLFLTYTNALQRSSKQLLERLVSEEDLKHIDVWTIDSLAGIVSPIHVQVLANDDLLKSITAAKQSMKEGAKTDADRQAVGLVSSLHDDYLAQEFHWVIDGRGVESAADYLEARRPGRGTRFDLKTRSAVWALYTIWQAQLQRSGYRTYPQINAAALKAARDLPHDRKWDCVVVDEAQDLTPVALRLALAVCRDPSGLYLTADEGQSIYGRGYSWKQVSDDLRIQGKTSVLKRNYRCSAAIQEAADQFLKARGLENPERKAEAVSGGPPPVCVVCDRTDAAEIAAWFKRWAAELHVPVWAGAVLTRSKAYGRIIADGLSGAGVPANFMESKQLKLDEKCVKVMTVHAAKGLEFPMLAVAGLQAKYFPSTKRECQDEEDAKETIAAEARLFHVAMTRAMRRLLVTVSSREPSEFFADLDTELWEQH